MLTQWSTYLEDDRQCLCRLLIQLTITPGLDARSVLLLDILISHLEEVRRPSILLFQCLDHCKNSDAHSTTLEQPRFSVDSKHNFRKLSPVNFHMLIRNSISMKSSVNSTSLSASMHLSARAVTVWRTFLTRHHLILSKPFSSFLSRVYIDANSLIYNRHNFHSSPSRDTSISIDSNQEYDEFNTRHPTRRDKKTK